MKLRLLDLQSNNDQARKLWVAKFSKGWVDIKRVLQYEGFFYIPEIIWFELISQYHNNSFASYFGIDMT